jgi:hypothetical protein
LGLLNSIALDEVVSKTESFSPREEKTQRSELEGLKDIKVGLVAGGTGFLIVA